MSSVKKLDLNGHGINKPLNDISKQDNDQNNDDDDLVGSLVQSPVPKKYYRDIQHRIFTNRSLHLEKITFFGFDMDYTLAEYTSPAFESLSFKCAIERMIALGYPNEFNDFEYQPDFPVRGLWFDKVQGNLLKGWFIKNIFLINFSLTLPYSNICTTKIDN